MPLTHKQPKKWCTNRQTNKQTDKPNTLPLLHMHVHGVTTPVLKPAAKVEFQVKSHGNNVRDVLISHVISGDAQSHKQTNKENVHCINTLVVLTTEWLPWLQTNWRDSGYKRFALVLKTINPQVNPRGRESPIYTPYMDWSMCTVCSVLPGFGINTASLIMTHP